MHILQFRPYKKLGNEELILEIDRIRLYINRLQRRDQDALEYLDQLFYEAKKRKISLSEKDICNRILYSLNDD